jgi:hypothetical protein
MSKIDRSEDRPSTEPPDLWEQIDWFPLYLLGFVILSGFELFWLLNSDQLSTGSLVLLAGLGGVIGSSLSPLLERRAEERPAGPPLRIFVQLVAYLGAGFGVAAIAFVVTSALLLEQPGSSASALGAAAFGGGIGFFFGRAISPVSLQRASAEPASPPAVVSALGDFADQVLGRPLLNYDGDVIANWQASKAMTYEFGRLFVQMAAPSGTPAPPPPSRPDADLEAPPPRAEAEGAPASDEEEVRPNWPRPSVRLARPEYDVMPLEAIPAAEREVEPQTARRARVLLQGGRDAPVVPFAISVISGSLDVQPTQGILAAPSDGISETLEFTLLKPQSTEQAETGPIESAAVLIDVSQAGRTVTLFEMEVSGS